MINKKSIADTLRKMASPKEEQDKGLNINVHINFADLAKSIKGLVSKEDEEKKDKSEFIKVEGSSPSVSG